MKMRFYLITFTTLVLATVLSYAQAEYYRIAPEDNWIKTVKPHFDAAAVGDSIASYYYLLVNRQNNLEREQNYYHYAIKVIGAEGLRDISNIHISFNPEYQKLLLHNINVVRDGAVISKMDPASIQVIQRETNLDRHLYDGRLTAVVNLTDIRIGDVIDYAFSIVGYNPAFAGHFSDRIYLQYSTPIEEYTYRLLAPQNKKLFFKPCQGAPEPNIQRTPTATIYTWERKKIPSLLYDTNTPIWYDPYPHVFITDFESWQRVVEWVLPFYASDLSEREQLLAHMGHLVKHADLDSTIIRAIRFVQDDIRYLGFEDGLYSYKPHRPKQVLEQRYGDCKDKSFLLCEILRAFGVDAYPMLVHSSNGLALEASVPSPYALNHCVVTYNRDGETFFVDPTISNQGGGVDSHNFPNYYKGLVLRDGETGLVDLPVSQDSKTIVTETFTMDEIGKGGSLHISTTVFGGDADVERSYLSSQDLQSIQKNYLDYYSKIFPSIQLASGWRIEDDREENRITIDEFYTIESLWTADSDNENFIMCEFYPLIVADHARVAQSPKRTMPYYVNFPVNVEQTTFINLPEEWSATPDTLAIEDDAFLYEFAIDYKDSTVTIVHKYKTKQPFINAEKVEAFYDDHQQILENLTYYLTYDWDIATATFQLSWFMVGFSLFLFVLCIVGAVLIYKRYDIDLPPRDIGPQPIGGWLVLVAIGLTLTPLNITVGLFKMPEYWDSSMWARLISMNASTRELLTGLLLFIELLYNISMIVFSFLVVLLFYHRRTILPRMVILLYGVSVLFIPLDTMLAMKLNPDLYTSQTSSAYADTFRAILVAVIWIPYFLKSQRVKDTFVLKSARNRTSSDILPAEIKLKPAPPLAYARPRRVGPIFAGIFLSFVVLSIIGRLLVEADYPNTSTVPNSMGRFFEPDSSLPNVVPMMETAPKSTINECNYAILQCVARQDESVHVRIITVKNYEDAKNALLNLQLGIAFSELAREKSNHPTRSTGGDMGLMPLSELDERFRAELALIGEGEYTGIIKVR